MPKSKKPNEPKPRTFFEDKMTGELLFFQGHEPKVMGGYVFQTNAAHSRRIMDLDCVEQRLMPVNPASPDYRFRSVRESQFYDKIMADPESKVQETPEARIKRLQGLKPRYPFFEGIVYGAS